MVMGWKALLGMIFANSVPARSDDQGKWIMAWADRHKIDRSKVEVKEFSHGGNMIRGLAAVKDIKRGEEILSIPEGLILRSWSKPSKEACNALWDAIPDAHSHMVLTLLLERSRGEASVWYEAIQGVPSLADFSMFYPYAAHPDIREEFKWLDIVSAHTGWRDNLVSLRAYSKDFVGSCFPELPSDDDFLWAECVVSTRQYTMVEGDPDNDGFIASAPLSDYANVASEPGASENTDWSWIHGKNGKFKGDGKFVVTATREIRTGEEILELYHGEDFAADYLLDTWGFMAPHGHRSREELEPLSLQQCEKLRPAIQKYLPKGTCSGPHVACNLATLARLQCADESEL